MRNIVIIGAGFGGAYAAKNLLKKLPADYKLVLINKSDSFTVKPLLHEVATNPSSKKIATESLKSFLISERFQLIIGAATKINLKEQTVHVDKDNIHYDYLLISIGAQTNFFNTPGAENNAMKLNTLKDAFDINAALKKLPKSNSKIILIGAGPTGIELAAEIKHMIRNCSLTILDRNKTLLPFEKEKFRKLVQRYLDKSSIAINLETGVKEIGKGYLLTDSNDKIHADLIIWTAGVKPSSIEVIPEIELPLGYFPVDKYLRLMRYPNVFAVGDCCFAKNPDNTPIPKLAQSAQSEGVQTAFNILASINKKELKPFVFVSKGFIVVLGKGYAIADLKKFILAGFIPWVINRAVYIKSMFTLNHKMFSGFQWFTGILRK